MEKSQFSKKREKFLFLFFTVILCTLQYEEKKLAKREKEHKSYHVASTDRLILLEWVLAVTKSLFRSLRDRSIQSGIPEIGLFQSGIPEIGLFQTDIPEIDRFREISPEPKLILAFMYHRHVALSETFPTFAYASIRSQRGRDGTLFTPSLNTLRHFRWVIP
ncbi:hypothetical protein CEXT_79131 [Caerostris extrusa]|uniref:Uncharacterized protein n=1 Tax=Caerostris extrusa TaxID=172846 RepID=A0AAV4NNR2_CAEEX|nr:hypothetical protein CEXT_79131 [Caerostris extrusa]